MEPAVPVSLVPAALVSGSCATESSCAGSREYSSAVPLDEQSQPASVAPVLFVDVIGQLGLLQGELALRPVHDPDDRAHDLEHDAGMAREQPLQLLSLEAEHARVAARHKGGIALEAIQERHLAGEIARRQRTEGDLVRRPGVLDDRERAAYDRVKMAVGSTLTDEDLTLREVALREHLGQSGFFGVVEFPRERGAGERCELFGIGHGGQAPVVCLSECLFARFTERDPTSSARPVRSGACRCWSVSRTKLRWRCAASRARSGSPARMASSTALCCWCSRRRLTGSRYMISQAWCMQTRSRL